MIIESAAHPCYLRPISEPLPRNRLDLSGSIKALGLRSNGAESKGFLLDEAMADGCSEHSEFKQECFREFMVEHTAICRQIVKNGDAVEYTYIDLYAGPGYLPIKPSMPGSPVIALECMQGLPFRAFAFEESAERRQQLADRVSDCEVFARWQDHLQVVLDDLRDVRRCGLIYADPNGLAPNDLSLIDCLKALANHPRTMYCDLLLHIPATTWKRVRGTEKHAATPTLAEELKRIGKPIVKISASDRQWQWVFVLLTRYPSRRFGQAMGWYDITSERGKLLLDRVTKTQRELDAEIPQGWLFRPE